ncbi:MAG: hypothetical protein JNN07_14725 [Verrucomicrobiales bacterium]|nr:hypothetical protein [Verrucomicrobiales bacterium]
MKAPRAVVLMGARPRRLAVWLAVSCCLMVLAVLVVWTDRFSNPHPATLTQAELSQLALREGRLYQEGAADPFSGFVTDHYPDGTMKSRSRVVAGKLHGMSEGWATNAQLVVREFFREGVSHGVRTKWHPNGCILSEATIVEGKLEGTFRRWHENGVLAEMIPMKKDAPDGQLRSYYRSGSPKALVTISNGVVLTRKAWKDGERREVAMSRSQAN